MDKFSQDGDREAIKFPRVIFKDGSLDFSFSGLKTSVLNYLNMMEQKGENYKIEDVCASFQAAVVDVLTDNLILAADTRGVEKIVLAGSCIQFYVEKGTFDKGTESGVKALLS